MQLKDWLRIILTVNYFYLKTRMYPIGERKKEKKKENTKVTVISIKI